MSPEVGEPGGGVGRSQTVRRAGRVHTERNGRQEQGVSPRARGAEKRLPDPDNGGVGPPLTWHRQVGHQRKYRRQPLSPTPRSKPGATRLVTSSTLSLVSHAPDDPAPPSPPAPRSTSWRRRVVGAGLWARLR